MKLAEGQKHGPYRLETRVGIGAQAQVWLAIDESRQQKVALKLLSASTPQAIRVFEREAQLASQLKSPHTVRVLDFGVTDDGIHFIAMEPLVGHDLDEMVKLFGPTVPAHAAHLVKQACVSLEEAHAMDFVHRDVKPSNLFAAEIGAQRDFVKLPDFGVARSSAEDTDQTQTAGAERRRTCVPRSAAARRREPPPTSTRSARRSTSWSRARRRSSGMPSR